MNDFVYVSVADLDREEEQARRGKANGHDKVRFPLVKFKDLKPGTAVRYLIKPIIPTHGLTLVYGKPKCGKSFWTFDAMMHVALGWKYRAHKVRQGTVIYCAFEGAEGFKARAEAFRKYHGLAADKDVPFYLMPVSMDLIADRRGLIHCARTILGANAEVAAIVLDTVNRSLNGSESDDEDMSAYIRAADELVAAFKCAVILVHHCGHEGSRPRGHSALLGAVDAQIAVTRDAASNVVAAVECAKDGPDGATVVSRLEQWEVCKDDDDDPVTSCVVVPGDGDGKSAGDRDYVTGAAKVAFDLLRRAISDAGQPAPASNHIPKSTRTTTLNLWRQYCYTGTVTDGDDPDTTQKAFVRAVSRLQALGLIGVWDEHVWMTGHAGH